MITVIKYNGEIMKEMPLNTYAMYTVLYLPEIKKSVYVDEILSDPKNGAEIITVKEVPQKPVVNHIINNFSYDGDGEVWNYYIWH